MNGLVLIMGAAIVSLGILAGLVIAPSVQGPSEHDHTEIQHQAVDDFIDSLAIPVAERED